MNLTVTALMVRAAAALKGQPPLDGTILVDFGVEGQIFIRGDNMLRNIPPAGMSPAADCTIMLSLDALTRFENAGDIERAIMLTDGSVIVEGDSALAEKFARILQAAG